MAKINEFGFKNICSYGNNIQRVEFSDEPELILIQGENGQGKTTISEALTFAAYGKSVKRKIKELANRFNKHGYTYIDFETNDGRNVKIERSILPNDFNLIIDGEPKKIAGKDKLDALIENQLLEIPFDVFSNNILLSINDFVSFAKMRAKEKRRIVNKIFPIEKIDKMHEFLKSDVKEVKEKLSNIDFAINGQTELLEKYENEYNELEESFLDEGVTQKNDIIDLLEVFRSDLKDVNEKIETCTKNARSFVESNKKIVLGLKSTYVKLESERNSNLDRLLAELEEKRAKIHEYKKDKWNTIANGLEKTYKLNVDELTNSQDTELRSLSDKLTASLNDWDNAVSYKRDVINKSIESIDAQIKKEESSYNNNITSRQYIIDQTKSSIVKNETHIKVKENILKDIKADICPTCDTELDESHRNKKIKKTEGEITKLNGELLKFNEAISNLEDQKKEIKESFDSTILKKNNEKVEIKSKLDKLDKINTDKRHDLITARDTTANTLRGETKDKLSTLRSEYDTLKDDKRNALDNEYEIILKDLVNEYDEKKKEFNYTAISEAKDKYNESLVELTETTSEMKAEIQDHILNKTKLTASISEKELELKNIESTETTTLDSIKSSMELVDEKIKGYNDEKVEYDSQMRIYERTKDLFSEDGLKKMIMNKFLPMLNNTIERLISELEYEFFFSFDDKFEPHVTHMGEDITVNSLSEGESKQMDIIIILAMLELIKYKHPKMNMLFLDEIFNSLSINNIRKVTGILKRYTNDYNMTIFVISHTPVPMEYFNKVINVSKDEFFSDLTIE